MDGRNFSKDFIADFINIYRENPCLWKIKAKEYSDRYKKTEAYHKLTKKLHEVEPNATKDLVVKKINSLRTAYRKERRKVVDSTKSGCGTDEMYIPTLWYYTLFDFLGDQDDPRGIVSNFDDSLSQDDSDMETSFTPPVKKTRKRKADIDTVIETIGTRLLNEEDEHDAFGRNLAHQLRAIVLEQRIYLEKIINDAVFEAKLGNLNKNCHVTVEPNTTAASFYSTFK